ncbi:hypothetical protein KJ865_12260, partial [Myxococcota bacterium]|nr:hypothetical protein [Myxococcota bacterium]
KVPDAYHQFAKKTADLPALILGSMDPVIPWPDPPKAILLGLTPLLTGLKMRSIINFTSEKAAQDFVNMAKRKIVEIIGKAPKGNPPMYIEILKKTGIKRLATRILATASARWDEVISLVKQATVKVKVKQ